MLWAEYNKALKLKKQNETRDNIFHNELNKSCQDMKTLARENSERRIGEKLRVILLNIGNLSLHEWKT